VVKAQSVSNFMADGFGCIFFVAVAEIVFKNECGRVRTPVEGIVIRDAAGGLAEPVIAVASDDDPRTPCLITVTAFNERRHARIQGGDVDIEGAEILRHPLDDPRHRPLTHDEIRAIELGDAQSWLATLLRERPIEVAIVGDLPRGEALDLASRYLGSLPRRSPITERTNTLNRVLVPREHPIAAQLEVPSISPHAVTLVGYRGPGVSAMEDRINLDVATRILAARLDLALKTDGTGVAHVTASAFANKAYPDFGLVWAYAATEPAKAGEALSEMEHIFTDFAYSGPTKEETDLAKNHAINDLRGNHASPKWWANTLSELSYRGRTAASIDEDRAALDAVDTASIRETLETYHDSLRKITITIMPVAPEVPGKK